MAVESVPLVLPDYVRYVSTVIFALAIVHTFCVKKFAELAHHAPEGSVRENFFHLLGEVEVVFGVWAGIFAAFLAIALSPNDAVQYIETRNYTEPLFVFVIMTVCATKTSSSLRSRRSASINVAFGILTVTAFRSTPSTRPLSPTF